MNKIQLIEDECSMPLGLLGKKINTSVWIDDLPQMRLPSQKKLSELFQEIFLAMNDPDAYCKLLEKKQQHRQNIQDRWNARCLSRRLRAELSSNGITCIKTQCLKL